MWLRELALPSIAQSDEYVPVSAKLSIMEVIDGEISVPSDMTYSLTMTLVDEMENPEHGKLYTYHFRSFNPCVADFFPFFSFRFVMPCPITTPLSRHIHIMYIHLINELHCFIVLQCNVNDHQCRQMTNDKIFHCTI